MSTGSLHAVAGTAEFSSRRNCSSEDSCYYASERNGPPSALPPLPLEKWRCKYEEHQNAKPNSDGIRKRLQPQGDERRRDDRTDKTDETIKHRVAPSHASPWSIRPITARLPLAIFPTHARYKECSQICATDAGEIVKRPRKQTGAMPSLPSVQT